MDGHRTAERRSVAYHRAIADRLVVESSMIDAARARVDEWRTREAVHLRYVTAWTELLALPVDLLAIRLVEESEQMRALRQVSPFAGALDARTRWAIWRSVA